MHIVQRQSLCKGVAVQLR